MLFKDKLPSIDLQVELVNPVWVCGYLAQQKISLNVTTLKFAGTGRTWYSNSMIVVSTRYENPKNYEK